MTFVSRSNTFKADEGHNDDMVMTLVFFAWLCRQEYYSDLIESAKLNFENAKDPEEENTLFMLNPFDDEDKFSDGEVVWYPA
jgi:hypothetical protein